MNFEFDDQQTQYIANTLAQRPYGEVFELMGSIQRQAATQQQQRMQLVGEQQAAARAPTEGNTGT